MDNEPIIDIDKIEKDLEPTKREALQTVLIATAETVLPVGGVGRLLDSALDSSTKRANKSLILIGRGLLELENRIDDFKIENLENDEHFKSILIRTLQHILKTNEEEKLEALQYAILNSALKMSPDDDLELTFLNYIDTFTVLHIKLLQFFNEPMPQECLEELIKDNEYKSTLDSLIFINDDIYGKIFSELEGKWHVIDNVLRDLDNKGLIKSTIQYGGILEINRKSYNKTPQIQEIGKLFLKYISKPEI